MKHNFRETFPENTVVIAGMGKGDYGGAIQIGTLRIIASWSKNWEHASASCVDRVPTYDELCVVKDIFWADNECVMQLWVPKRDHINCHPYVLHLWRPTNQRIPRPPADMVGPANVTPEQIAKAKLQFEVGR